MRLAFGRVRDEFELVLNQPTGQMLGLAGPHTLLTRRRKKTPRPLLARSRHKTASAFLSLWGNSDQHVLTLRFSVSDHSGHPEVSPPSPARQALLSYRPTMTEALPEDVSAERLTDALRQSGALGGVRVCDVAVGVRAILLSRIIRVRLTYDGAADARRHR